MAPPALDGAASCLAISDRRAATYRIKASAVGVLSGSAEADSSLVGHGGDPLGPHHRRELAEYAVGLLQPRVAATPPSVPPPRCTSEARPQLLSHDLHHRAGVAILGSPAPLLEPTHDHHPAALRQRLGRMLGLVAPHDHGEERRLLLPATRHRPPGTWPGRSRSRCAVARGRR